MNKIKSIATGSIFMGVALGTAAYVGYQFATRITEVAHEKDAIAYIRSLQVENMIGAEDDVTAVSNAKDLESKVAAAKIAITHQVEYLRNQARGGNDLEIFQYEHARRSLSGPMGVLTGLSQKLDFPAAVEYSRQNPFNFPKAEEAKAVPPAILGGK